MAKASRQKGLEGEHEVAVIFAGKGFEVRNLEGAGDHLCISPSGARIRTEVKRAERWRLDEWIPQMESEALRGTVSFLVMRRNHGPWYLLTRLDDGLKVIQ